MNKKKFDMDFITNVLKIYKIKKIIFEEIEYEVE